MQHPIATYATLGTPVAPVITSHRLCLDKPAHRPTLCIPRTPRSPVWSPTQPDEVWRNAAEISSLSLSRGSEASELEPLPTRVRLLWQPRALHIRFDCVDDELFAPFVGRDLPHHQGDVVEVFLDPQGDHKTWFEFQVSPTNQVLDKRFDRVANDAPYAEGDLSFDLPGLATDAGATAQGWVAELTLPAAGLVEDASASFASGPIGCNLIRYDHAPVSGGGRRLISMNWSLIAWGQPHVSPYSMGQLLLCDEE